LVWYDVIVGQEKRRDYVRRVDGEKQSALWNAAMQTENVMECINVLVEEVIIIYVATSSESHANMILVIL
jgi:hypothetical protein